PHHHHHPTHHPHHVHHGADIKTSQPQNGTNSATAPNDLASIHAAAAAAAAAAHHAHHAHRGTPQHPSMAPTWHPMSLAVPGHHTSTPPPPPHSNVGSPLHQHSMAYPSMNGMLAAATAGGGQASMLHPAMRSGHGDLNLSM